MLTVDKARITASFWVRQIPDHNAVVTEIARPTYVDNDVRGVMRAAYVRCMGCFGIERSRAASPDPRVDECACPLSLISYAERVAGDLRPRLVWLAGDLVCDNPDPKLCSACRWLAAQFKETP